MAIYNGETLSAERVFDDHNEAAACAIDARSAAAAEKPCRL